MTDGARHDDGIPGNNMMNDGIMTETAAAAPAPNGILPNGMPGGTANSDARRRALRRTFSRFGFAMCTYLLASAAAQIGAIQFPAFADWVRTSNWGLNLYAMLPQYIIGIPLFYLVLRPIRPEPWEGISMRPLSLLSCIPMCLGLGFAGGLIGQLIQLISTLITGIAATNPVEVILSGEAALLPQIVCVGIAAPVVEELLFRKALIDRLHRYGDRTAIFTSALLFALLHGNFNQLFYAFGIGLLLGYVYVRTHCLLFPIVLHMSVNLLSGVFLQRLLTSVSVTLMAWLSLVLIGIYVLGLALFANAAKNIILDDGNEPMSLRTDRSVFWNAGFIGFALLSLALSLLSLFSISL